MQCTLSTKSRRHGFGDCLLGCQWSFPYTFPFSSSCNCVLKRYGGIPGHAGFVSVPIVMSERVEMTVSKGVLRIGGTIIGGTLGFLVMLRSGLASDPYLLMVRVMTGWYYNATKYSFSSCPREYQTSCMAGKPESSTVVKSSAQTEFIAETLLMTCKATCSLDKRKMWPHMP
jgi:hypothetical protein